jgi:D-threo-aldose 1-dehydrogenase
MPHSPADPRPTPDFGAIGYGAANVGNLYRELSDDEALAVLEAAWDEGIRYYDTAPHYGLGLSERRLGAFLQTKPRDEFVLSTKVGRLLRPNPDFAGEQDLENDFAVPASLRREWDFSADGIRRSVEESLERLGLDRVDVLYLHDPERHDLALAEREAIPALAHLREEGLVRAVGVGSMVTDALLSTARTGLLDLLTIKRSRSPVRAGTRSPSSRRWRRSSPRARKTASASSTHRSSTRACSRGRCRTRRPATSTGPCRPSCSPG